MKNIIVVFLGFMISLYTVGLCFGAFSIETRKNTLDEHVSRVLQRTLEEEYRALDTNRVAENLKKELQLDRGKNGKVEAEIKQLDLQKGLIQVVVKEAFRQINGEERVITCEKTVIMDSSVTKSYTAGAVTAITEMRGGISRETSASGVYANAFEYYNTYEGKMIFKPADETPAGVFYGTRGKETSTARVVYETLGWRVTVKDNAGAVMDQVFYALDGGCIRVVDSRLVAGYRYILYSIELDALKQRLSPAANEALKHADCAIVFDACVVVKNYGVRQGGLTDDGIAWGQVHTTYDGIVNAVNWTATTKENLKSYFDKEIPDMFFEVSIGCGEGIESVTGNGRYCYGTEVTISATPKRGYQFLEWIGPFTTSDCTYTFTVYDDVSLYATTKRESVAVNLHRNLDAQDNCVETIFFEFDEGDKRLRNLGWSKEGYHQTGWSTSRIVMQPYFSVENEVTDAWLERVAPSVDLYATWKPNEYRIVFLCNGAEGEVTYCAGNYTENITMLSEGYEFEEGSLSGWSLSADASGGKFLKGEIVSIRELAQRAGVSNVNGATIYLYAQKDCAPRITCKRIYVSLMDAINGVITEHKLAEYVTAWDAEDGQIAYGSTEKGTFQIVNFMAERYLECREELCIVEKFYARDSAGNETYENVEVYIVADVKSTVDADTRTVRFISEGYYKDELGILVSEDEGGLAADSVWRWNLDYMRLLDEAFN